MGPLFGLLFSVLLCMFKQLGSYTLASTQTHSGRDPINQLHCLFTCMFVNISSWRVQCAFGCALRKSSPQRDYKENPPKSTSQRDADQPLSPLGQPKKQSTTLNMASILAEIGPCWTMVAMIVSIAEMDKLIMTIHQGTWDNFSTPK